MPTSPTPISALPTAPARTQAPATFVTNADAFLAALPTFRSEANALATNAYDNAVEAAASASAAAASETAAETAQAAAEDALTGAVSASAYMATSASSHSIGAGSKAFVLVEADRAFAVDDDVEIFRRGDRNTQMRGAATGWDSGTKTLTVNVTGTEGSGGPYTDWMVALAGLVATPGVGKHAIWIPASAMTARTTNGAAAGTGESTTNKVMRKSFDFDAATVEYIQFTLRMPKSWDEGTVTFVPAWSHAATATNFGVSWGLQAVAVSDDEAGDAAFGTAQYSNDTGGTTGNRYAGPESSAITIAGTPAAEDFVIFQVLRKADDVTNDTLAIDAHLHGITLYITTDAGTDA